MLPAFGRSRPRRAYSRLVVEMLEDRCVLSAVSFMDDPVVPAITEAMKVHLQAVLAQGQALGNRPDVFAKVGDSITWLPDFLNDLGSYHFNPSDPGLAGSYTDLASTIDYFRFQTLAGVTNSSFFDDAYVTVPLLAQQNGVNSFNQDSVAAYPGWTAANELDPGEGAPLAAELASIKPAFAFIMLGTNDASNGQSPASFQTELTAIVDYTLTQRVIPILSTIPDNHSEGGSYEANVLALNQVIANVAAAEDIPLCNYWLALQTLPNQGISGDGVHPDAYPGGSGIFTPAGLQYGFNVRNLTAVQALSKLLQVVVDNGAPDFLDLPLTASTTQYVTSLYDTLLGHQPDPAGLHGWGELVQNGFPLQVVAQGIWDSPEHRGREVVQYYATYLSRTPSSSEEMGWVNAFLAGETEEQAQAAILGSTEFRESHASAADFVDALYADVLSIAPDSSGLASWEQALQGAITPAQVAQALLSSPGAQELVVGGYYSVFLNRQATLAEVQAWVSWLQQNELSVELAGEELLASDEFYGEAH